jgi:hypothetical protein
MKNEKNPAPNFWKLWTRNMISIFIGLKWLGWKYPYKCIALAVIALFMQIIKLISQQISILKGLSE